MNTLRWASAEDVTAPGEDGYSLRLAFELTPEGALEQETRHRLRVQINRYAGGPMGPRL